MALEGRMKCVKYFLFALNIVFSLYFLVPMVGMASSNHDLYIEQEPYRTGAIALGVICIVTLIINFFGCYGAWKENYCMVTTFVILQSLYLVFEIYMIVAMSIVIYSSKFFSLDHKLQDMVREYNTNEVYRNIMDRMQQQLQCCGAVNFTDWVDFQPDGISVPKSCCWNVTREDCGYGAIIHGEGIFTEGCRGAHEVPPEVILYSVIAIVVPTFIVLLGLVLGGTLMYGIRKGYSNIEVHDDPFPS